jgi:ATP-dependent helicase/nuclease subunit B
VALETKWVRYGRPAARALRDAISGVKGSDPLAPATVVVPSNHVGVAARRLLASGAAGRICENGTGIAAVTFLTVYRLGELLGAGRLSGSGRRPVSTPVIAAALRAALAEDPGMFAPVADHPSTEMAFVAAYRELRDLSPEALVALSAQSHRASDVVRLHLDARDRLQASWYDEEDLLDAAVDVVESGDVHVDELGSVVVYLPERISRHGARLLRTVGEDRDLLVIAGTAGEARADSEVELSIRRLGGSIDEQARAAPDALWMVEEPRTCIVTTSDADEEVRSAVRKVMATVGGGTPLDRIAILFPRPDPYARLVYEQLRGAGIAMNGTSVMPLSARVAGRTLLGLLRLPEGNFRREDLFAWLAGARLHFRSRWAPVTAWERLSREAGVIAGRKHWDGQLARLADELDNKAEQAEADPDSPPWRAEKARADAERARGLRTFVLGLIDDLAQAVSVPATWPERAAWAHRCLNDLLGNPNRRRDWPTTEERAAERVDRALDRLGCLGAVEGPVSLEVFARTLELELDADLGRVGRMGEGVLVAPVSMGVGLDLDLVIVLGLAEGSFPTSVHDDSLLPDREREAAGDELSRRSGRIEQQHRSLLAALAGASRQVLYVPRGDLRRSQERVPSRWVLDIASRLAGTKWWSEDLMSGASGIYDWLEHVASFDSGLRSVDFPATDQEFRLRYLVSQATGRLEGRDFEAMGDPALRSGAAVIGARRSSSFTRFDGNLAGRSVPSPTSRPTSATRLEGWASCPFAYLLRVLLGVEAVENPEELLVISPLDRGSLVHEILERFIADVLARPETDQPKPTQGWSDADRVRLDEIAENVCADYEARGLTGRSIFWGRDKRRIIEDLLRLLELDDDHRAALGLRPVAAELAFGLPDSALGPVALDLPDGRSVEFRGKADRVDIGEGGTLHVVDYKTGKSTQYSGMSEENPDLGGRKLQLPVYGQAARQLRGDPRAPVRAEYWFASTKGEYKRIGYPVTSAVLEHVGQTLKTVVDGIEAGVFPPYPTQASTSPFVECPYCDPDALGVSDLQRAWQRKRHDSGLAVFADLVEPPPEEDAEDGPDD